MWSTKNKYLLAAYLYAVEHLHTKSISHRFPIHGHSQSEDCVYSFI